MSEPSVSVVFSNALDHHKYRGKHVERSSMPSTKLHMDDGENWLQIRAWEATEAASVTVKITRPLLDPSWLSKWITSKTGDGKWDICYGAQVR